MQNDSEEQLVAAGGDLDGMVAVMITDEGLEGVRITNQPDIVQDIMDFRAKFPWDGEFYEGKPRALPFDQVDFWYKFILEEAAEYRQHAGAIHRDLAAIHPEDGVDEAQITFRLAEMLDAGVDMVYVILGMLQRHGLLPMFYQAWERVHAANMAKECANGDASKSARNNPWDVIKPPGWEAPEHDDLVEDHAHRA